MAAWARSGVPARVYRNTDDTTKTEITSRVRAKRTKAGVNGLRLNRCFSWNICFVFVLVLFIFANLRLLSVMPDKRSNSFIHFFIQLHYC
jgi:hypothetical protein